MKKTNFPLAILFDHAYFRWFITMVLLGEAILGVLIIWKVPYTEIDWIAYMQEVAGYLSGERDYINLKGDTGPLVYPAGFVYVFSFLYDITNKGEDIRLAQYLFLALYLVFLAVVLVLYHRSRVVPPWAMLLLCMSKRIHSIFILRLFNDCVAMFFLYIAIWLFLEKRWSFGCFFFSFAVSIKMNILLFAPALLLLMWRDVGFWATVPQLGICAALQVVLGYPFLATYPMSYISRAFEFSRQFFYIWTVNFRFLPEEIFLSKKLALGLLITHVTVLLLFLNKSLGLATSCARAWQTRQSKPVTTATTRAATATVSVRDSPALTLLALFGANFIGIAFARSLHYQFYVWYFHTLPLLLWVTPFPNLLRVVIFFAIEYCWNVFPSTSFSSGLLWVCHLTLLVGIFVSNFKPKQL